MIRYQITINYGYDIHELKVSQADLQKIQEGNPIRISGQGFAVEGDWTQDTWCFNCAGLNSLKVEGEDGYQIFEGLTSDAVISEL
jgi:hypothetical protein